jgi:hypothetical protein
VYGIYPRWLESRRDEFDVFHIVDHSYANLVRALPANRAIVTCHDLDAFQGVLPGTRGGTLVSRALAHGLLEGYRRQRESSASVRRQATN